MPRVSLKMSHSDDRRENASRRTPRNYETNPRAAKSRVARDLKAVSDVVAAPSVTETGFASRRGDALPVTLPTSSASATRHLAEAFFEPAAQGTSSSRQSPHPHALPKSCPRILIAGSERAHPVSEVVLREVVETAIGFGRGHTTVAERSEARDKLLKWLRAGSADAIDLFRSIVAGPSLADASFNVRVLSFLHFVTVMGGPSVLAVACHTPVPHRPSPGARICLDVLKAVTQKPVALAMLDSASYHVASWDIDKGTSNPTNPKSVGLEMYAVMLGCKLSFHSSFFEIEANYSLDRYYRQFHVENAADHHRRVTNLHRRAEVISQATANELASLAKAAASVAAALDRLKSPVDVVGLVFAEALNSFVVAKYMQSKVAESAGVPPADSDLLDEVGTWLSKRLKVMLARGGEGLRSVQRFTEPNVIRFVEQPSERQVRPESRHRRGIPCEFTSFDALHNALAPSSAL